MSLVDCAIIGSGPAALLAADQISAAGKSVKVFERKSAPGWKLLVAGSSGLNITYDAPLEKFAAYYSSRQKEIARCLEKFPPSSWIEYVASLGEEPYVGTSRRYFVRSKTAASLLQSWLEKLKKQKVEFLFDHKFMDWEKSKEEFTLKFENGKNYSAKTVLLALGGASWENSLPEWANVLRDKNLEVKEFAPANAGYHLKAPQEFFQEAEGKPIKGLILKSAKGEKQGELMITKYGLEGTPVYTMGCQGSAFLDLKPDLTLEKLQERVKGIKDFKKLSQQGKLSEGALLLIKCLAPQDFYSSHEKIAHYLKNFPIILLEPRALSESISSSGGLSWDELKENLELKNIPGIFCAGEMVDWDAPTGGFLIQASASMGFVASQGILKLI